MIGTIGVIVAGARMQFRESRGDWLAPVLCILQPTALTVALVNGSQTRADRTAVLVGAVLTSLWSALVWGAGGLLRRDQYQGTLGAVITAGPQPASLVLLARTLGSAARSVSAVCATGLVLAVCLHIVPSSAELLPLAVGLLVATTTGAALGQLLACLFLVSRHSQHLSSALLYPVHLLGGLIVPVHLLPVWLRWPSTLFSLHWVDQFLVVGLRGGVALGALAAASALTCGYALLGLLMFARIQTRSRRGEGLDFE